MPIEPIVWRMGLEERSPYPGTIGFDVDRWWCGAGLRWFMSGLLGLVMVMGCDREEEGWEGWEGWEGGCKHESAMVSSSVRPVDKWNRTSDMLATEQYIGVDEEEGEEEEEDTFGKSIVSS